MLVLTRRVGEEIIIKLRDRRAIRIFINSIRGDGQIGQVKLGFEADPNIAILRKELAERIERGEA